MSSFPKEIDPATHPFYQKIYIRLMPARGYTKNYSLCFRRTGSMNVPSWSPDSKRIAFISNTQLKTPNPKEGIKKFYEYKK